MPLLMSIAIAHDQPPKKAAGRWAAVGLGALGAGGVVTVGAIVSQRYFGAGKQSDSNSNHSSATPRSDSNRPATRENERLALEVSLTKKSDHYALEPQTEVKKVVVPDEVHQAVAKLARDGNLAGLQTLVEEQTSRGARAIDVVNIVVTDPNNKYISTTPLYEAAVNGHENLVEYLLLLQANPNLYGSGGRHIFEGITNHPELIAHPQIFERLLNAHADANYRRGDKNGQKWPYNPIGGLAHDLKNCISYFSGNLNDTTKMNNTYQIAQLLISRGANVLERQDGYYTPLMRIEEGVKHARLCKGSHELINFYENLYQLFLDAVPNSVDFPLTEAARIPYSHALVKTDRFISSFDLHAAQFEGYSTDRENTYIRQFNALRIDPGELFFNIKILKNTRVIDFSADSAAFSRILKAIDNPGHVAGLNIHQLDDLEVLIFPFASRPDMNFTVGPDQTNGGRMTAPHPEFVRNIHSLKQYKERKLFLLFVISRGDSAALDGLRRIQERFKAALPLIRAIEFEIR